MSYLYHLMGSLLRYIYDFVVKINPDDLEYFSNYAIAVIIFSILLKLITIPLTLKQTKSQAKIRALQPKLQEIQEKYKNDQMTIARKQQELYQKEGANPMSGCLPLLIQFPIIIAMFRVIREPIEFVFKEPGLYDSINKTFFWIQNLNEPDNTMIIAIIAAGATYLSQKVIMNQNKVSTGNSEQDKAMESTNRTMSIMMPLMMLFIYRGLPSVLPLYLTINTIMTLLQQKIAFSVLDNKEESRG